GEVGVEQVQVDPAGPGAPDLNDDRLAGEVDGYPFGAPVQARGGRVQVLPVLVLPAVGEALLEPPLVHQADGDHRFPQIARGLLDAPGEHAQPAGVDAQLRRDAVLHAEVRNPGLTWSTGKVTREV